jgi:hypothetical protein
LSPAALELTRDQSLDFPEFARWPRAGLRGAAGQRRRARRLLCFYWIAVGDILSVVAVVLSAWVLMVEILR